MQASIYGNLINYPGAHYGNFSSAFLDAHEIAHKQARSCYSGVALDELSEAIHRTLRVFVLTEKLPGEWIEKFWAQFVQINTLLVYATQKFEPIEEIFATALGIRLLPTNVRNAVKPIAYEELRKRNWGKAYKAFAEACDKYKGAWRRAAFLIFETVCRISNKIAIDSVEIIYSISEIYKLILPSTIRNTKIQEQYSALYQEELDVLEGEVNKKIESILKRAGIPDDVFWSTINEATDVLEKNSSYGQDQSITLIGRPSLKEIIAVIRDNLQQVYEDKLSPPERTFYESIRQQLSQLCGIVCPFASHGKPCCGLKEELWRLYRRLPEEDRKQFKEPHCDLIR
jgi:hypothetical protein